MCPPPPLAKPCLCSNNCLPFHLEAVFCPPTHPPTRGGGGCWDWMGYGRGIWGGLHGGCLWEVVVLHRAMLGGSWGFRRPCMYDPPPPSPQPRPEPGLRKCLPLLVCPPAHPRGDWDSSTCLVLSPPCLGGRCLQLSPSGPGECDTMGSDPLLFGVWHTQSELHDLS